jgi:hypothetical protein
MVRVASMVKHGIAIEGPGESGGRSGADVES